MTSSNLIRVFQRILVYSAVFLGVCNALLWVRYYDTRPRVMDTAAGRTIPLNTHGIVVYLTSSEHRRLDILMIASGGCFLIAILTEVIRTRGQFLSQAPGSTPFLK